MDTETTHSYTARHLKGTEDIQSIAGLINECNAVDDLDENRSASDVEEWLNAPIMDKDRDVRLWEDQAGQLAAFALVQRSTPAGEVDGYLYFRVRPEARNSGIEDAIFAWGEGSMAEWARWHQLPGIIYAGAFDHYRYYLGIIEEHGYKKERYFFTMRRPLGEPVPDPVFPEGFTFRHVQAEDDVERWVEMFNQTFIDHWNFHPQTVERRRYRMSLSHYRPENDLVAIAPDGTFAAFCICDVNTEHNERTKRKEGWIGVLGTRRGFRKIGLGKAMLLASLLRLKSLDLDTAVLDVDADNPTGALGLYESVGFTESRTEVVYSKQV